MRIRTKKHFNFVLDDKEKVKLHDKFEEKFRNTRKKSRNLKKKYHIFLQKITQL